MRDAVALRRYLQRHVETGLPTHTFTEAHWQQTLVLPAYRESPDLLDTLMQLPAGSGRTLVILVLNRPDFDSDPLANAALRSALAQSRLPQSMRGSVPVFQLNTHTDLYLHDMELQSGPTAHTLGVGLARKTGCDLALQWMAVGGISGQWLCSTDADATLPPDYFVQLASAPPEAVAAVFPFRHVPGEDDACNVATALYELRLHHYVLGLEFARSPYTFHTLGSCLAVRSGAYAHAHGFPKRAGAEDFYLLNKLAKLGKVARLRGECIQLQSRQSSRVPFGTGPAVAAIIAEKHPGDAALFYHPQCFTALAAVLASLPALAALKDPPLENSPARGIAALLRENGLTPALAEQTAAALGNMGIGAALAHCRRQSKSTAQFLRHFHQWFDGFRTLKLIHTLRDGGLPALSLAELGEKGSEPNILAVGSAPNDSHLSALQPLQQAIRQHWGWR